MADTERKNELKTSESPSFTTTALLDKLDGHLEEYLDLIDQYQKCMQSLSEHMSGVG